MPAIESGWGTKLTGNLANYANASKGTILLGDIQAHMLKEHAKSSTRRQDVIHPSEMAKTSWCPRSTYYRIKACREASDPFLKPAESSVSVQILNIFDEGHYIHDKWQKRLQKMGDLWGNWSCICGDGSWKNCLPPDCGCWQSKKSNSLIYHEVPLSSEQYLISGHADGAIPRLDALIEIKSVGTGTVRVCAPDIYEANTERSMIDLQGLWKDIKEPFPEHVNQGQLYLTLCSMMGLSFSRIIFLYESKFNQGAKEFVVEYDPAYCDDMLKQAEIISTVLEGNQPNREDCPECRNKNLNYPFICECDDPVKCPNGTCKDCEMYSGPEKSYKDRVGNPESSEGPESPGTAIRRSTRSSTRIIRPS